MNKKGPHISPIVIKLQKMICNTRLFIRILEFYFMIRNLFIRYYATNVRNIPYLQEAVLQIGIRARSRDSVDF